MLDSTKLPRTVSKEGGPLATLRALATLVVLAASANAATVQLPPGASIDFAGLASTWPAGEFALDFLLQTAPDSAGVDFDAGVVAVSCAETACTATVRTTGADIVMPYKTYPSSVYAVRIEAREVGGGVDARFLRSARVEQSISLPGVSLAAPTDALWSNPSASSHALPNRMRLWSAAGVDDAGSEARAAEHLFRLTLEPETPDLVGQWFQVVAGQWEELGGGPAGAITGGSERSDLCWVTPRPVIFRDGFESGGVDAWSAVEP